MEHKTSEQLPYKETKLSEFKQGQTVMITGIIQHVWDHDDPTHACLGLKLPDGQYLQTNQGNVIVPETEPAEEDATTDAETPQEDSKALHAPPENKALSQPPVRKRRNP